MSSELMDEFIFDSRDHLTTAGTQLMELENKPDSLAELNALLGTLHTIKGNSGFVNLRHLYSLLHGAENLLQTVRETDDHVCSPNVVNRLFQVLDTVEAILTRLENGEDDEVDWLPALNQAIGEDEASIGQEARADEAAEEAAKFLALHDLSDDSLDQAVEADLPVRQSEPGLSGQATSRLSEDSSAGWTDGVSIEPVLSGHDSLDQAALPAPAETSSESAGTVKIASLRNGQLAEEGRSYEDFLEKTRGRLIMDLSDVTGLTGDEMRALRNLAFLDSDNLAVVLDENKQPDFWRAIRIWSLDSRLRFFPDLTSAEAAMGA
ncbi:MAG: Hpt domain-containing protein [Deltaproteobacteria bacterium]|nr:Hpt domain-containing protein [Deltaproteobacteria bacterium]